jgi:hypothetical protein
MLPIWLLQSVLPLIPFPEGLASVGKVVFRHHPSSIIHHQSSIIDHQSSTIDHQSSIINHRSSIIDHQSSLYGSPTGRQTN